MRQLFDRANNELQVIGHMIGLSEKMERLSFFCELSETSMKGNSLKRLSLKKQSWKKNAKLSCLVSDEPDFKLIHSAEVEGHA